MSKKEEIISLIKTGETIENIVKKGFNRKYVKEVMRGMDEYRQIEDDNSSILKRGLQDPNYNTSSSSQICVVPKNEDIMEQVDSTMQDKNKICSFSDIESIERFLQDIKANITNLHSLEVTFKVTFKFGQDSNYYDQSIKKDELKCKEDRVNPIEIYRKNGEQELKKSIAGLEVEELIDIIRRYLPDPRGYVYKWKDKAKIIEYIIQRTPKLAEKGNVFFSEQDS